MERIDSDFYSDRKYCDCCKKYVSYLMSIDTSYCVECGAAVHLFSKDDWQTFNDSLSERRPKGGRPRKDRANQDKESA
ncbi:MAG: hypothetical protein H6828_15055 [Planctomycetes bacterium]|nr:hypothetical protein [Planctomycetota bacterium]